MASIIVALDLPSAQEAIALVDELGDLDRAIDLAAELGDVQRKPVWMKPRRGLRDLIGPMMATSFVDAVATRIEERLTARYDYQHRL